MQLTQVLRQWVPPIVLGAIALGAWQAASRSDFEAVGGAEIPYEQAIQTPVFSARRLPVALRAPIDEEAVIPTIQATIEQSPSPAAGGQGQSCLLIQDGDRQIGPSTDAGIGIVPASNQKVVTTFAALNLLGTDFRFTTKVKAAGDAGNGTVEALYLVGDGDPFLSTEEWKSQYEERDGRFSTRLEDLAESVAASGVTSIGTLYGDESLYDTVRSGPWHARLIEQRQSGPLSALTVNEGFVDWPTRFQESFRPRSPTDNPPLHAAAVFGQLLSERGVSVGSTGVAKTPTGTIEIASVQSPLLSELATHINSYSSNLGAELLVKRIGLDRTGEGSTAAGARAILSFLGEAGIPGEGLVINDGSGLDENNRLTCAALLAILSTDGPDSALGRSLSIAGERGSLKNRFVDTPAVGNIYAKTGTLRGVRALSGFARSSADDDSYLGFAYIVNDDVVDDAPLALQDALVAALVAYPAGPPLAEIAPMPAVPVP